MKKASAYRVKEGIVVKCPHCKKVNGFEDFTSLFTFVCHECGGPIKIADFLNSAIPRAAGRVEK
jgi:hypothetical protein